MSNFSLPLTNLRNGVVDGIIVAGTGRNGRLIRDIKASGIAVVQVVRQQEASISSVLADYEACGFDAVNFSLTGHAVGGMLETSMTSMEMPAHEMGEKAAEMVIREIEASSDL